MSERMPGGRLREKVIVVTGAASGIGRAAALACAREGARVVLSDRAGEAGQHAAAAVRAAGGEAEFVAADVRRAQDVTALIERILTLYGRLDAACNNAGVEGRLLPTAEYPDDLFEDVIQVNLVGVWRCMRTEIHAMQANGGGSIVNVASVAGLVGAAGFSAYVASKHGVVGLTRSAALEYAKSAIRINAVCPGVIETPMLDRIAAASPDAVEALQAASPVGRAGTPQEVAEAIVWLMTEAASFVTGHALAVDGGYVAQ